MNQELTSKELAIVNWRKWSLHQKRAYVKGSGGGFNLKRSDIAALDDDYRGMQYTMKTIRMAVDVIDDLSKQLTTTQQALDSAVEALLNEASNAYCRALDIIQKPEGLGWKAKVACGEFGEKELKAHCDSAEQIGFHRGIHHATRALKAALASINGSNEMDICEQLAKQDL